MVGEREVSAGESTQEVRVSFTDSLKLGVINLS